MASSSAKSLLVPLEDRKIQAYKLCREYLGGSWKEVSFEDFCIKTLVGGLSNKLYICSLPDDYPISEDEHKNVFLRIYGKEGLLSDIMIFALLAERKVGPQLFAIFPEGRLEEFIPGRNLTSDELKSPTISVKIARKLKQYHEMRLPLSKEPKWMWECISRFLDEIDEMTESDKDLVVQEICKKYDLHKEFHEVRTYITSKSSPVVFCHNDLNGGNIMAVPQSADNDSIEDCIFQFIDFEFSAYNYRAYDLANHFGEWVFKYRVKEPPHFGVKMDDFPTKDEQLTFIRAYLGKDKSCNNVNVTSEEQEFLDEIKRFTMVSHFFWGVWAVVQSKNSTRSFGFSEFAKARFEIYDQEKKTNGLS